MPTLIQSVQGFPDWLHGLQAALAEQSPCVLITLVKTQGSVPCEVGARMLVTAQSCSGTIGGGILEWLASQHARSLLTQPQALSSLETFTLGTELGQCCGGVASIHYESFPLGYAAWFETLVERWRQGFSTVLKSYPQSWPHTGRGRVLIEASQPKAIVELVEQNTGSFCLTECLTPPLTKLVIFGAGHVAQALVQVLLPLDWQIIWVDNRAQLFPKLTEMQAKVVCLLTDPVKFAAEQVMANSFCLVMTHEHSLDLELCAQLLARKDLAYVGLIGSQTKAARFRRRLREQGLTDEQLAQLICPIGLAGIHAKQPAAIAISVAAQLLQLREEGNRTATGEYRHEPE